MLFLLQSHPLSRLKLKRLLNGQFTDLLLLVIVLIFIVVERSEELFEDLGDWGSDFGLGGGLHVEGWDLIDKLVLVCTCLWVDTVVLEDFLDLVILLKQ